MLTAEQIKNNWEKLLDIIKVSISSPRNEQLLEFYKKYEDRIILMPASHKTQYHNCFPGGYVDHVLRVVEGAIKIHNIWKEFGAEQNYTLEELIFSAINHDLGKIGTETEAAYIDQTDQWKKDKMGEMYQYNNKIEYMSVPDRSLYLLTSHNIPFSRNELLAIKLHDGMYDDANKPYLLGWLPEQKPRTSLIFILHHADMMAARIEFEREWLPKFKNGVDKSKKDIKLNQPAKVKIPNKGLNDVMNKFFKEEKTE